MHPDPQSQAREALLGLHRQLQENARRLGKVDCDDPNVQAVLQAVQELNERVADMVAETALLAMEGRFEDYTLGRNITMERVKEIYRLFKKHGYRLGGLR